MFEELKELREINESHQKLNGELRQEINDLKTVVNQQ